MNQLTYNNLKIVSVIAFALALSAIPTQASAVVSGNLEVTFEDGPALFSNVNIAPGFGISKTVTVKNLGSDQESIYTSLENYSTDGLANDLVLNISATSSATTYFNDTIAVFSGPNPTFLGTLAGGDTRVYSYAVSFADSVGNTQQGKTVGFDLIIGFENGPSINTGAAGGSGGGNGSASSRGSGTPTVAGASTSTDNGGTFWQNLIDQLNDFSKGIVDGASTTNGSSTGGVNENEFPSGSGTSTVSGTTDNSPWYEMICDYLWILVVLWLLASALAYWRNKNIGNTPALTLVQIVFGGIALVLLASSLFFGVPCSLWPSLIVAVGAVAGLFLVQE